MRATELAAWIAALAAVLSLGCAIGAWVRVHRFAESWAPPAAAQCPRVACVEGAPVCQP